jgi:hypothetical protein
VICGIARPPRQLECSPAAKAVHVTDHITGGQRPARSRRSKLAVQGLAKGFMARLEKEGRRKTHKRREVGVVTPWAGAR